MTAAGLFAFAVLLFILPHAASAQGKSNRERNGLFGPVKSVRTEISFKECRAGELTEVERSVSSEEYEPDGGAAGARARPAPSDPFSKMLSYPFDEGTPRIEEPVYGEDGALLYTNVYTYDNNARRAEHVSYKPDGAALSRWVVVFDERGRIAETKAHNAGGAFSSWNVLRRDERGNEIESSFYREDGTLVEVQKGGCSYLNRFVFTYKFDAAGNWVTQVISMPFMRDGRVGLEPFAFKRRTIVYY